ncbi:MAG: cation:proton antiporter [Thermoplasmata archaeon]|nr:cation:proton antiporter [Thermoplasmata archaeon]
MFLSGAEIDPVAMPKTWKTSASTGHVAFLAPFRAAWGFTFAVLGWACETSLRTGVALSTTSVAVVDVVLIETGASRTATGKLILSACFITDLGTALTVSLRFARPIEYIFLLLAAVIAWTRTLPRPFEWLFAPLRGRAGEPEVKLLFFSVVNPGPSARRAGTQAVLPAYALGLGPARVLDRNPVMWLKLRTLTLAFLTPFFFIPAGRNISVAASSRASDPSSSSPAWSSARSSSASSRLSEGSSATTPRTSPFG